MITSCQLTTETVMQMPESRLDAFNAQVKTNPNILILSMPCYNNEKAKESWCLVLNTVLKCDNYYVCPSHLD